MVISARFIIFVIFFGILFAVSAVAQQGYVARDYNRDETPTGACWLQVAAFGDWASADKYASDLLAAGETPVWGAVELPGLGRWIRVLIGPFETQVSARRHAQALQRSRIISSFISRTGVELNQLESIRTLARKEAVQTYGRNDERSAPIQSAPIASLVASRPIFSIGGATMERPANALPNLPPGGAGFNLALLPVTDLAFLSAVDPIEKALEAVLEMPCGISGGLRLTGDVEQGLERLRWMVGSENASLVSIDENGGVSFDLKSFAKRAAGDCHDADAAALMTDAIATNEGLRLLLQLTYGPDLYQLHIGSSIVLNGINIAVSGAINLDNNYDSRINPSRQDGKKLPSERPADGYDSLVVINPSARWFNLESNKLVSPGAIAFHELAEAYAKVHLQLQYLPSADNPGAHEVAVARELKLRSERWDSDIVVSAGLNRVFKSERDVYRYLSQSHADADQ